MNKNIKSIWGRKVSFANLVTVPKRERKITMRKKKFTTHLLLSEENQKIIWKADEITIKKEEKQLQRQKTMKEIMQNERKGKKKVTCRKDTVKARKLPVKRLQRGPKLWK